VDLDRAQAIRGTIFMLARFEVAGEREDDQLFGGKQLARGRELVPEAEQGVKRVLRNPQCLAQLLGARRAE